MFPLEFLLFFKLALQHLLKLPLFLFLLSLSMLLFLLLFLLSPMLFSLAFEFFNFHMLLDGSLCLTFDGTSFVSFQEIFGIGYSIDVIVDIGTQMGHFPRLELHVEELQFLLAGKLDDNLILVIILDNPADGVLLEGSPDFLVRYGSNIFTALDGEETLCVDWGS